MSKRAWLVWIAGVVLMACAPGALGGPQGSDDASSPDTQTSVADGGVSDVNNNSNMDSGDPASIDASNTDTISADAGSFNPLIASMLTSPHTGQGNAYLGKTFTYHLPTETQYDITFEVDCGDNGFNGDCMFYEFFAGGAAVVNPSSTVRAIEITRITPDTQPGRNGQVIDTATTMAASPSLTTSQAQWFDNAMNNYDSSEIFALPRSFALDNGKNVHIRKVATLTSPEGNGGNTRHVAMYATLLLLSDLSKAPTPDQFRPPFSNPDLVVRAGRDLDFAQIPVLPADQIALLTNRITFDQAILRAAGSVLGQGPMDNKCGGNLGRSVAKVSMPTTNSGWGGTIAVPILDAYLAMVTETDDVQRALIAIHLFQRGLDIIAYLDKAAFYESGGGNTAGRFSLAMFTQTLLNDPASYAAQVLSNNAGKLWSFSTHRRSGTWGRDVFRADIPDKLDQLWYRWTNMAVNPNFGWGQFSKDATDPHLTAAGYGIDGPHIYQRLVRTTDIGNALIARIIPGISDAAALHPGGAEYLTYGVRMYRRGMNMPDGIYFHGDDCAAPDPACAGMADINNCPTYRVTFGPDDSVPVDPNTGRTAEGSKKACIKALPGAPTRADVLPTSGSGTGHQPLSGADRSSAFLVQAIEKLAELYLPQLP